MPDFLTSSHKHSPAAVINVIVLQITAQQTVSQQCNVQCQVQSKTQWDKVIVFLSHSVTTVRYHLLWPKFTKTRMFVMSNTTLIITSDKMAWDHLFWMTKSHNINDRKQQKSTSNQIRCYEVKRQIRAQSYGICFSFVSPTSLVSTLNTGGTKRCIRILRKVIYAVLFEVEKLN